MEPHGDRGAIVQFYDGDIALLCNAAQALCGLLQRKQQPGVVETVAAYSSVAIYFRPGRISYFEIEKLVRDNISHREKYAVPEGRRFEMPVVYGGEFGPDLIEVAARHSLTPEEAIERHVNGEYTVATIGFAPGFPYLLGLHESLATPRWETPRALVSAGSVGIGGNQTGIYSLPSPGGWNIIGRTPVKLFNPRSASPSLLTAGDRLRFIRVNKEEFYRLQKASEEGNEFGPGDY